jgi:hypothetical protein
MYSYIRVSIKRNVTIIKHHTGVFMTYMVRNLSTWPGGHMIINYHMYAVPSANDPAFLSSIEYVWCVGKKCKVIGTALIME